MLKITRCSGLATLQDLGRAGLQHWGVPAAGVLDTLSHRMAQVVLNNPANSAAVELMGRLEAVCSEPCVVMLGSRGGLMWLNHQPVLPGCAAQLHMGDVLVVQSGPHAPWVLLQAAGGFDAPLWQGSRSTLLAAQVGGLEGRALKSGDVLKVIPAGPTAPPHAIGKPRLALPSLSDPELQPSGMGACIRITLGPDFDGLPAAAQQQFLAQRYHVSSQASRMGYRLEGHAILNKPLASLPSYTAHPGLIQLPPSGFPIVLLADAQATGGYPRLASVVRADLWKFAHLASGACLHFQVLDFEQAHQLQCDQQRALHRLEAAWRAH